MRMEPILIRALLVAAICYAATADAGKFADKPKFKVGDRVRADPKAEWVMGCGSEVDTMCTVRGKQPWAGMKTKILAIAPRTCAKDVGAQMRKSEAFADPSPEMRKMAFDLLALDSCDEWSYKVDFGPKGNGEWTLEEHSLTKVKK